MKGEIRNNNIKHTCISWRKLPESFPDSLQSHALASDEKKKKECEVLAFFVLYNTNATESMVELTESFNKYLTNMYT